MASARILVTANPPRRGEVFPRLSALLGDARAARLARAIHADQWSVLSYWITANPEVDLMLALNGAPDEFPMLSPTPSILRQVQGDLGRRIATLFAGALGQRDGALILAPGHAALPIAHIEAALAALPATDILLCPARGGGLWGFGARSGPQALHGNTWLDGIAWDQPGAAAQIEDRARRMSLRVAHGPEWAGRDNPAELPALRELLAADPERAPETAAELRRPAGEEPLSIVIPTLQESVRLDDCLRAVQQQPGPLELIVADGGSTDKGPDRALTAGATVAVTGPGRGRQLAAGARLATGDVLLFLHVDAQLPPGATDLVRAALARPGVEAGAFVTRTIADKNSRNLAGPLLGLADLRSRVARIPHGEQALFVRREAYQAVGGFRPLPVCEDQDLARRLAARAPLVKLRQPVTVSGRSIQSHPLRALFVHGAIPPLFRIGVDPSLLARLARG